MFTKWQFYNCYTASLGSLFPGQMLHIKLIVSQRWSNLSSTIIAANTKDDDCIITDSNQLSQRTMNAIITTIPFGQIANSLQNASYS